MTASTSVSRLDRRFRSTITLRHHSSSMVRIAVEPPDQPWPNLPGKNTGAGPFYLVWELPRALRRDFSEQWPYQLASLTAVESPTLRWPQLAADPALPLEAPPKHGQQVFATNCLPCHLLNGGGAGEMGPDLGWPMNATEYLTDQGLLRPGARPENRAYLAASADAWVRRRHPA